MTGRDPMSFMTAPRTFVRVYRLPPREQLTSGYCFGKGNPIVFLNVDWFEVPLDLAREDLIVFIKAKQYYDSAVRFLVLGDHPDLVFIISEVC